MDKPLYFLKLGVSRKKIDIPAENDEEAKERAEKLIAESGQGGGKLYKIVEVTEIIVYCDGCAAKRTDGKGVEKMGKPKGW